jgi:predicted permease
LIVSVLLVVLPVFLVIGAGYVAVRSGLFSSSAVDGLMVYTQSFAVPCLLFRGIVDLDLGAVFDGRLMLSFYAGAIVAFALGVLAARSIFHRRPGEAVAIGFGALFSNSVLLGLPIMERAYGTAALAPNFAIISVHAPFCYLVGITAMEVARADGSGIVATARAIARTVFRNALMLALALGFAVNLLGVPLGGPVESAVAMVANSALPAALFALGGVLTRYAFRASLAEAGTISALSLLLHPAIAYALAVWVRGGLSRGHDGGARPELSQHADDPRRGERGDRQQHRSEAEVAVDRQRARRPDPAIPRRRRGRRGDLGGVEGSSAPARRRCQLP